MSSTHYIICNRLNKNNKLLKRTTHKYLCSYRNNAEPKLKALPKDTNSVFDL